MSATTAPATLLVPPTAPEAEWKAARLQGITASEIAVVLGISPFDSPFNLYWKKQGVIPDDFDSDRLSLGHHLEPWICDRFRDEHPDLHVVAPAGLWASGARPWQLATPDGLIFDTVCACGATGDVLCSCIPDPVAVAEFKTSATYEHWGEEGTDDIPVYYRAQVLWQMDVMGVGSAFIECLFLTTQKRRTYEIAYDAGEVEFMRARAVEFLDRLERADVPPVDGHDATGAALRLLHPDVDDKAEVVVPLDVAEEYRQAHAALKAAKERAQAADNAIRHAMGDARYAVDPDGAKVCSRSVYERKAYEVAAATIDKLNPGKRQAA